MVNLFSKFSSTELVYIKKFTENHEDNEIIRFYDNDLKDIGEKTELLFDLC